MKANYHTHTYRCNHADGTDEEYVLAAIEAGFDELGFSDHGPWRSERDKTSFIRMSPQGFRGYADSVLSLKEKYADKISIKLGLESEYYEELMPWLRGLAKGGELDYIILGHHYASLDSGDRYFGHIGDMPTYQKSLLKAMRCDLYAYVAHPDLNMKPYGPFDSVTEKASIAICREAVKLGRVLEYNLLGARRSELDMAKYGGCYPHPMFWQIAAAEGVTAIIGTDAHSPKQLDDGVYRRQAEEFLTSLGIKLVDTVPMMR